jgi:hypothetical protein
MMRLPAQEVLRGEVRVDLEPVYGEYVDAIYPLDTESAHRRALEEAALCYSAMIYGWSFEYDMGEPARGIDEGFELSSLGTIPFGDQGLFVTDAQVRDRRLYLWTDYRLNEAQKRRMGIWKSGKVQTVQAIGHGPLGGPVEVADWLSIKKAALEDAAQGAVRAMLQGSARNRPKEVRGYIGLSRFPTYWMDAGQWAAGARFRVEITEMVPFGAY